MSETVSLPSDESDGENLLDEELVTAIHAMLVTDYEAKRVAIQLGETINDWRAEQSLKDIEKDELIHVGEMLKFLRDFSRGSDIL